MYLHFVHDTLQHRAWSIASGSFRCGQCTTGGGLAGFTADQVEEVRCVVRMLPVFFTTILYWTIYAQVLPMAVRLFARSSHVRGHLLSPSLEPEQSECRAHRCF